MVEYTNKMKKTAVSKGLLHNVKRTPFNKINWRQFEALLPSETVKDEDERSKEIRKFIKRKKKKLT